MKRNLCLLDRVVRALAGGALATAGLLFAGRGLGWAMASVGALLVLSASVGFCHVYGVLRMSTLKKK